ncbi:Trp biosynthesis-associated membrane protein [Kribbella sp. CA-247076]|uniref:Trp biosynthesis-associated membrane protein n=1 Tax=Kribbella sp. CA-247076 TaxID=3239941 RepID=UPI003D8C9943
MRPQRLVDVLTLAALVLLALSAYLTWTTVNDEAFKGYDLTRAPVFLALAGVAAVIVMKLAGTALRRVLAALVVVLGVLAVVVAFGVRPELEELTRMRPALTLGTDSFEIVTGPAPWFALAGGVALGAAGVVGVLTAHRWRRATTRYERDPAPAKADSGADQWKAIDAGEDPTL